MPSNEGYINIVAVMQKFFDQALVVTGVIIQRHFENNEVPMSVMMKDLLNTYKLGWKTSYYQNTYDYKTDDEIVFEEPTHSLGWHDETKSAPVREDFATEEEFCDACAI